jgi:hypothetical protein
MTKYFAKIGLNNKVKAVHCLADEVVTTEKAGIDFLTKIHHYPFWVQTFKPKDGSPNSRKNYARPGLIYDEDRDAFREPQPYASWTLNEDTCQWEPPVALPDDDKSYTWNEETTSWDLRELPE